MDGEPSGLPVNWTEADDCAYCLSCSRALAGEAALDSAPDSSSREERVRLRRDAVIEFEIGRAPDKPNRAIAQACRTSATAVASVRTALEDDASPRASDTSHAGAPGAV
jgi:hypothetical protein